MALIPCPECQKQISDTAESCPNCGYKIEDELHYFLQCPSHNAHRTEMFCRLKQVAPVKFSRLLDKLNNVKVAKEVLARLISGHDNYLIDIKIFPIIQDYIINTNRFN